MFLLAELAVAVAGWGLQINPFDQPNVQQAKDATKRVLAGYQKSTRAVRHRPTPTRQALRGRCSATPPRPAYVAHHGLSTTPRPEFDTAAIGELRETIRGRDEGHDDVRLRPPLPALHRAVPQGRAEDWARFLQLIHDGPEDVEIPGGVWKGPFTFTTLKNAQAIGDLETLRSLAAAARAAAPAGPTTRQPAVQ